MLCTAYISVAYLMCITAVRSSQRAVRSRYSFHATSEDVASKTSGNGLRDLS